MTPSSLSSCPETSSANPAINLPFMCSILNLWANPDIIIQIVSLLTQNSYYLVNSYNKVPYSEHSSFTELREFVSWLDPGELIPSVLPNPEGDRGGQVG
eukprot:scaffold146346_cov18-Tisochrysis_lutea.AAC.1